MELKGEHFHHIPTLTEMYICGESPNLTGSDSISGLISHVGLKDEEVRSYQPVCMGSQF
jgi:hypothetical protein